MMAKLKSFLQKPFHNKLNSLYQLWRKILGVLYYRQVFASFGSGSILYPPTLINNPQCMHIGKNVLIRQGVRLEAVILDPANPPELYIGDNVTIEQDVHIAVMGKVTMHDNSSLAPRCALNCASHPFFDIDGPAKISSRLSFADTKSFIEIGAGSLIGMGTVVQMNVKVGKHVVVGSNSVVKRNIPDYSVADGNPATVILRYDAAEGQWKPEAKKS